MAEIHRATLTPSKLELVTAWMGRQRWYAAQGSVPRLRRLGAWRLDDPEGEVGIETLLVADDSGLAPVVYQVPLTYRGAPLEGAETALVGTCEHSVLGTRWVYDGTHDPVYAAQLLELIQGRVDAQSSQHSGTVEEDVSGEPRPSWSVPVRAARSRVLAGEQSNTSVIADCVDAEGRDAVVIMKVFRTLGPGENPDVVLPAVLAGAGSAHVPAAVGSVRARWPEPVEGGVAVTHLAVAQEFLTGAEDAWRVMLRAAGDQADATERIRALGGVTAEVHRVLASSLPTDPADPDRVAATVRQMGARLAGAVSEAPALAAHEEQVRERLRHAAKATWPAYQRIHGDLHLGQVLDVPGRGWVLLDFEGEPLRPLAERNRTDQWLRDVAGMLRSLDYVGGAVEQAEQVERARSARAWVEGAQRAFLDGYAAHGTDPRDHSDLLTAYVLDKALYEVVYEARHRPGWLTIPIAAIDRLLARPQEDLP